MTVATFFMYSHPKNVRFWTIEVCVVSELNAPVGLLIKNSRGGAGAQFALPLGANKCAQVCTSYRNTQDNDIN
jgi:hypothetical protein